MSAAIQFQRDHKTLTSDADNHPPASSFTKSDPGLPRANPTKAFWQEPAHPLCDVQSPSLPLSTDILIIGSGITGCSVTKHLLENSDYRVTVLEARSLCSGATGRNGGHLTSAAPFEYLDLVAAFGNSMAMKVAKFTLLNVEKMYEIAKEIEESEVRLVDGVTGYFDAEALRHSRRSLAAFETDAPEFKGRHKTLDATELQEQYGFHGTCGGIAGPAGALWPYRLVTRLYSLLVPQYSGRFSIETSTPAMDVIFDKDDQKYQVTTTRGVIKATHVIHATNGYSGHLLPLLRGKIYPLRGTMTVQRCPPLFPKVGGTRSWSTHHKPTYDPATGRYSLGLYYMTQNETSGDIYLGGEDKKIDEILTSDDTTAGDGFAVANLQSLPGTWFGEDIFPEHEQAARLKSSWSGIMGFTGDGLPLVGNLTPGLTGRHGPGEWIAAGFNGYGMVNCWMSGVAVANMVLGRDAENSAWFPEVYQVSEKRLNEGMNVETAFGDFFHL
ncbi:unnamed protein product [Diplocarpon coronariae]|uniref:FAD dependent oxidoreductase domain-containing protein n=1 Tax=Diplocarpon coronariae TaxID=2795749 RepID=A0A218YWX1_9HELO|nr:hypothetical protein B2J93_1138 [Marssonina coronariae]